jgi:hypothetical protein
VKIFSKAKNIDANGHLDQRKITMEIQRKNCAVLGKFALRIAPELFKAIR